MGRKGNQSEVFVAVSICPSFALCSDEGIWPDMHFGGNHPVCARLIPNQNVVNQTTVPEKVKQFAREALDRMLTVCA